MIGLFGVWLHRATDCLRPHMELHLAVAAASADNDGVVGGGGRGNDVEQWFLTTGAEPQETSMTTHRTHQVWLIIFKLEQKEMNICVQELLIVK